MIACIPASYKHRVLLYVRGVLRVWKVLVVELVHGGRSSRAVLGNRSPVRYRVRSRFYPYWYGEIEGRAFPKQGFHPNLAAVPFKGFLTDRQADSASRLFIQAIQALKNFENFPMIERIDPYAVIPDQKETFAITALSRNFDDGTRGPVIFDGIMDKVLENLAQ